MNQRVCTLFAAICFTAMVSAQVPRLWGTTTFGGASGQGTLFSVGADGSDFTNVFDFDATSGWGPEGGLCLAPNGKLYGTTAHGGTGNAVAGTLYSFDPEGEGFHKIMDFDILNGGGNWGSMVVANGLLYGAQYMGGGSGGSIYSVDPATDAYTIVHALNTTTDGSGVTDNLFVGSDGLLYGTAHYGGANNKGTIFRFDPATLAYEKLHDFTGDSGGDTPYGGLCEAANGWFYGTTFSGGLGGFGIVYKYDPSTDQFVTLADLDTIPGSNCWSSMVEVAPDLLVGSVGLGGLQSSGFLYGIAPSTDAFELLVSFTPVNGGAMLGNPTLGSDGQVYGLGQSGGSFGTGTVFRFDPVSHALTVLHSLNSTLDGGAPRGELVEAGTAVGIQERTASAAISVSPNPTSGPFTVQWSDHGLHQGHYLLRDVLGRVVDQGRMAAARTTVQPPSVAGTYLLTVESGTLRDVVRIVVR